MANDSSQNSNTPDEPAPGGGPNNIESRAKDNEPTLAATCIYDGKTYNLNDTICDGMKQEWRCGSTGWYRTGKVCVR